MKPAANQQSPEPAEVLATATAETARRLGLGSSALARIIGVSQPTASRLLRGRYRLVPDSKPWELAAQFLRLYRSLSAIVGGEDELARAWLDSPNAAFAGQIPRDLIQRVDGLVHACDYLDAHRARV